MGARPLTFSIHFKLAGLQCRILSLDLVTQSGIIISQGHVTITSQVGFLPQGHLSQWKSLYALYAASEIFPPGDPGI